MDGVIENKVMMVEESFSASHSFSEQVHVLSGMVEGFVFEQKRQNMSHNEHSVVK